MMRAPRRGHEFWLGLLAWLAVTAVAAATGAVASVEARAFYVALERPAWAPPAGVFAPVWMLLYILMAVAAWLVWRERGLAGARGALGLYIAQLAVNALWSWLFFRWHEGALALAESILLWLLLLATVVAFWRVRLLAGALLVPYLAWVSYAVVLTAAVWRLNPQLL